MDPYQKYRDLREAGASAETVYQAGQADGLDPITLIRMVRGVCDLSLAEAKTASGASARLSAGQDAHVGAIVWREERDPDEGLLTIESRVVAIDAGFAVLDDLHAWRVTSHGVERFVAHESVRSRVPLSSFAKPLGERLSSSLAASPGWRQAMAGLPEATTPATPSESAAGLPPEG